MTIDTLLYQPEERASSDNYKLNYGGFDTNASGDNVSGIRVALGSTYFESYDLNQLVGQQSQEQQESDPDKGIPYRIFSQAVPGYSFIQPIPGYLRFVFESNLWLISDDIFVEYGVGKTRSNAKIDYINGLISYYETLSDWASEENRGTQLQLEELREFFVKLD